jgi:fatty-acid desaturase
MSNLLLRGSEVLVAAGTDVDVQIGAEQTLFGGAISAFFTTLVVGVLLLAFAPDYTERMTDDIFEDPVGPFLYGIMVLLCLLVMIVLLVISIIGILFVIPLVIVAILVWAAGSTLALLGVADRLVSHEDNWLVPLLIAAVINAGLALSGVGGLISLVLGALGFGTILEDRYN